NPTWWRGKRPKADLSSLIAQPRQPSFRVTRTHEPKVYRIRSGCNRRSASPNRKHDGPSLATVVDCMDVTVEWEGDNDVVYPAHPVQGKKRNYHASHLLISSHWPPMPALGIRYEIHPRDA